jgi:hypothetical protein
MASQETTQVRAARAGALTASPVCACTQDFHRREIAEFRTALRAAPAADAGAAVRQCGLRSATLTANRHRTRMRP